MRAAVKRSRVGTPAAATAAGLRRGEPLRQLVDFPARLDGVPLGQRKLLHLCACELEEAFPSVPGCRAARRPRFPLSWLTCFSQKQAVELFSTPSSRR